MKNSVVASCYEEDLHNLKKGSQTYSHEAMRLEMLTASVMKWLVEIRYFSSAFLLSGMWERKVFLRPPFDVFQSHMYGS